MVRNCAWHDQGGVELERHPNLHGKNLGKPLGPIPSPSHFVDLPQVDFLYYGVEIACEQALYLVSRETYLVHHANPHAAFTESMLTG